MKALEHRPEVEAQLRRAIGHRTCWHFDAWLYRRQLGHDAAWLYKVETRGGGRGLLTSAWYLATLDTGAIAYQPLVMEPGELVTLQDRDLSADVAAKLDAIHWRYIYPMSCRAPSGFTSRSVRLHYIRAPSVAGVPDDVQNFWAYARTVPSD